MKLPSANRTVGGSTNLSFDDNGNSLGLCFIQAGKMAEEIERVTRLRHMAVVGVMRYRFSDRTFGVVFQHALPVCPAQIRRANGVGTALLIVVSLALSEDE